MLFSHDNSLSVLSLTYLIPFRSLEVAFTLLLRILAPRPTSRAASWNILQTCLRMYAFGTKLSGRTTNGTKHLSQQVWTYKRSREIARRMPCYRGEVPQHHPPFPVTSEAHCQVLEISDVPKYGFAKAACHVAVPPTVSKQPPVKDIKYSAEDDRILEDWVRSNVSSTSSD